MARDDRLLLIASQRFGLGGDAGDIGADPRGWARDQARRPADPLPDSLPGIAEAIANERAGRAFNTRLRAARALAQERGEEPPRPPPRAERGFSGPNETANDLLAAWLDRAPATAAPLAERLVLHWHDHFTTSRARTIVGHFLPDLERTAIRPHIHGPFAAMLKAAVLHPAMLIYLDGAASAGPDSPLARRRPGRLGLNENLGREILELHTLGVDGGYGQEDVRALSLALSGWTIGFGEDPPPFPFDPARHQPGPKVLLGRTYAEDGPGQAPAMLDDLARHPATARHVARRFVRHLVGGGLPGLEARMAAAFAASGGQLGAMTRALVEDLESWGPPRKLRPPIELLLGAARLLGGLPPRPAPAAALDAMGQPFATAPLPAGWPAADDAWTSPDGVKTRLDWAAQLAAALPAGTDARALLHRALGPAASAETRRAVDRAEDGRQALALLLLSPEFQRR
ncbi:DUF1800 family protein [Roseococcus sp. DSY-14]|uniref:DUF1800 domain-containing protein n=1 Tax=Roseococcus sp. DSY-14 TaxID=3369650 RepID=UPI00387B57D0